MMSLSDETRVISSVYMTYMPLEPSLHFGIVNILSYQWRHCGIVSVHMMTENQSSRPSFAVETKFSSKSDTHRPQQASLRGIKFIPAAHEFRSKNIFVIESLFRSHSSCLLMMKIYMHKDVVRWVKIIGRARGGRLVTNRQHFVWLNFKLFAHCRLFIGSQSINFSYDCDDVPANIKLDNKLLNFDVCMGFA